MKQMICLRCVRRVVSRYRDNFNMQRSILEKMQKKKKNSLLQERRRLKLNKRASEAKIGKVAVIKCVKDTENLESSLMYILEEMTNWQN